jgi:metal-responsive CopG/Arc/MetJ family transcriptional regulator
MIYHSMASIRPMVLFVFNEGLRRWQEYFKIFLVDGDPCDPKRTEKEVIGVSLALVDSELDPEERRLEQQIERISTTSSSALYNHYTDQELLDKIKYCNEIIVIQYNQKRIKQGTDKMGRAVKLKTARTALTKVKAKWKEEQKIVFLAKLEDYTETPKRKLKERMQRALESPTQGQHG